MKEMKRLIGITGVILLTYTVLSATLAPAESRVSAADPQTAATENTAAFTAREADGRIVICVGNRELFRTDTEVSSLPKIDRLRLREGIDFYSAEELKQFIEDYCS